MKKLLVRVAVLLGVVYAVRGLLSGDRRERFARLPATMMERCMAVYDRAASLKGKNAAAVIACPVQTIYLLRARNTDDTASLIPCKILANIAITNR